MISSIQPAELLSYFEHLVGASARGMLVLVIAAALCIALRRAKASVRHLLWSAALVSLLVLPALSSSLPSWRIAVLPPSSIKAQSQSSASNSPGESEPVALAETVASEAIIRKESISDEKPARSRHESAASETEAARLAAQEKIDEKEKAAASRMAGALKAASFDWMRLALLIWLAGALLLLARIVAGAVSVWRMRRQADEITDGDLINLAGRLRSRLGLKRRVVLLETGRVTMPVTCGLFRSAVMLPAGWREWSDERREVVMLHEFAHAKRWDCVTQMLAQVACAVYWFNPFVWIAARRHRIEREIASDDLVLDSGTKASDYAGHLLDIARSFQPAGTSLLAAVALARRSQLEGRVLAILDSKRDQRCVGRFASITAALVILCVALPLSVVRLSAQADSRHSLQAGQPAEESTVNPASALNAEATPQSAIELAAETERRAEQMIEAELSEAAAMQVEEDDDDEQQPEPTGQIDQRDKSAAIEALRGALMDQDAEVREQAAFALSQSRDPQVVDALIEALKDADPQVRERAAWGLGLRGNRNAVDPLVGALQDSAWQVREQAAWALGLKGDSRAVEALINALRDENAQVRKQSAWALGLKGDSRAVDGLIAALKDSSSGVREQAAWALGLRGDRRALNALKELAKDQDPEVRKQAAWALGMILIRRGGSPADNQQDNDGDDFDLTQSNQIEVDQKGKTGRGVAGGVTGGVKGGIKSGTKGMIKNRVRGGISSGVRGGVTGGVKGGVSGGVTGGVLTTGGARITRPDAEAKKPRR